MFRSPGVSKTTRSCCIVFVALAAQTAPGQREQLGTAFTYQGRLSNLSGPVHGTGGLIPALAHSYETAKLLASDGGPGDEFGYSVAVDGDTAVIGARYDDDLGADSGSAYVFRFDGYDWVQEAKLLGSDGAAGDWFGHSVGIHGDTIVVGACHDDDLGNDYGSAYVFRFDGYNWVQEAKLLPGDAPPGDSFAAPGFGCIVAIDGATIAVSAQGKDEPGADSGSVYVFVRNGTDWSQQAKLLPSDGATWEYFGVSVAIDGDDIVVGTYGGGSSPIHAGSAYVFVRSGTTWTQQVKLVAPDAAAEDHFGMSVDIDGDTVVGGAYADDDLGASCGSAHVFVRSGTSWSHQAKLLASDGAAGDQFGLSLGIEADTIVVGANGDDDSGDLSGSAYVFVRSDLSWSEEAKLLASDGAAGDCFGRSATIDGDTAVIGAPYDDDLGADSGSAYVLVLPCSDNAACDDSDACTFDECDAGACTNTPRLYGDVNGDGTPNVFDIFCQLDVVAGADPLPEGCDPVNADIEPCVPNGTVNVFDMFEVLAAIAGDNTCNCPAGPP